MEDRQIVKCVQCGRKIRVQEKHAGRKIRCPSEGCKGTIQVPETLHRATVPQQAPAPIPPSTGVGIVVPEKQEKQRSPRMISIILCVLLVGVLIGIGTSQIFRSTDQQEREGERYVESGSVPGGPSKTVEKVPSRDDTAMQSPSLENGSELTGDTDLKNQSQDITLRRRAWQDSFPYFVSEVNRIIQTGSDATDDHVLTLTSSDTGEYWRLNAGQDAAEAMNPQLQFNVKFNGRSVTWSLKVHQVLKVSQDLDPEVLRDLLLPPDQLGSTVVYFSLNSPLAAPTATPTGSNLSHGAYANDIEVVLRTVIPVVSQELRPGQTVIVQGQLPSVDVKEPFRNMMEGVRWMRHSSGKSRVLVGLTEVAIKSSQ